MTATTAEVHAIGRENAIEVLREASRKIGRTAESASVREALATLPADVPLDRQVAMFWRNLSIKQLRIRLASKPPEPIYTVGKHGKATKAEIEAWDAAWTAREAKEQLDAELAAQQRREKAVADEETRHARAIAAIVQREVREKKNARRKYAGRALESMQAWLVTKAPNGYGILGHADALSMPVKDIQAELMNGATIARLTPRQALGRLWANGAEREAWEWAVRESDSG